MDEMPTGPDHSTNTDANKQADTKRVRSPQKGKTTHHATRPLGQKLPLRPRPWDNGAPGPAEVLRHVVGRVQ